MQSTPQHASQIATLTLYVLAEKPDLVASLREEVQASVAAHGWTGAALDGMCKLDSLLRETIRFYGGNLGERARAIAAFALFLSVFLSFFRESLHGRRCLQVTVLLLPAQ